MDKVAMEQEFKDLNLMNEWKDSDIATKMAKIDVEMWNCIVDGYMREANDTLSLFIPQELVMIVKEFVTIFLMCAHEVG